MRLKNILFFRGLYILWNSYFGLRKSKFGYCANNVVITPPVIVKKPENVFLYSNTQIASNSYISATNANFTIHENCCIAEGLTVHTGNHASVVGVFCSSINEKNKPDGYDKDIVVDSDVWIGCNVTLLSGVHIGRGVTIAAGAVVNKDIPPYCIAGGVPAKVINLKWSINEIIEHERSLYPEHERLTVKELNELFAKYKIK